MRWIIKEGNQSRRLERKLVKWIKNWTQILKWDGITVRPTLLDWSFSALKQSLIVLKWFIIEIS